ncbi:MAG: hypothetical protein N2C14_03935, partial [Planctomycetales bacterium]
RILTWLFLLLGTISVLVGFFAAPFAGPEIELPLGQLSDVAVDEQGNVYCVLEFYSRIQVYDREGVFLTAWQIDSGRGGIRVHLNSDNLLQVATTRTGLLLTYDVRGQLISEQSTTDHYTRFRGLDSGARGTYYIRSPHLFPAVLRQEPSGQWQRIIDVPWHKWILMAPFPGSLFWGLGGLFALANKWVSARQAESTKARNTEN